MEKPKKLNFSITKGYIGLCTQLNTQEDICFQDRINKLINYCQHLEKEIKTLKYLLNLSKGEKWLCR
jgi:hypothetical protein